VNSEKQNEHSTNKFRHSIKTPIEHSAGGIKDKQKEVSASAKKTEHKHRHKREQSPHHHHHHHHPHHHHQQQQHHHRRNHRDHDKEHRHSHHRHHHHSHLRHNHDKEPHTSDLNRTPKQFQISSKDEIKQHRLQHRQRHHQQQQQRDRQSPLQKEQKSITVSAIAGTSTSSSIKHSYKTKEPQISAIPLNDITMSASNILVNSTNMSLMSNKSPSISKQTITSDQKWQPLAQAESTPTASDLTSSLWGPPRLVILVRQPNKSLGISIVGGKLDVCSSSSSTSGSKQGAVGGNGIDSPPEVIANQLTNNSSGLQVNSFISGIFIKHVLDNSPAGLNGTLKTGDRILAVNDIDLSNATHDRAVEVIRNAQSPVRFIIQSLILANNYIPTCEEFVDSDKSTTAAASEQATMAIDEATTAASSFSTIEPEKEIINQPNKYNYSSLSIYEKYGYLVEQQQGSPEHFSGLTSGLSSSRTNELHIFKLERSKPNESLGLSLSGNVNLAKTSVFVCGIYDNSIAQRHGLIKVGDQILEINGHSLYGRAHSNVTPLIKNIKDLDVYLVILRLALYLAIEYISFSASLSYCFILLIFFIL
jgi:hypothetical protein